MKHLVFDTVWNIWIVLKSIFLVENRLLWCQVLVLSNHWQCVVVLLLVINISSRVWSNQIQILLVKLHFTCFWRLSDDVWAFDLAFALSAVFTIKNLMKVRVKDLHSGSVLGQICVFAFRIRLAAGVLCYQVKHRNLSIELLNRVDYRRYYSLLNLLLIGIIAKWWRHFHLKLGWLVNNTGCTAVQSTQLPIRPRSSWF